jgi:hypothetical protein
MGNEELLLFFEKKGCSFGEWKKDRSLPLLKKRVFLLAGVAAGISWAAFIFL